MDAAAVSDFRTAIEKAIEIKGSEEKLAFACGVTQPAIWKAKTSGKISPRLAIAIHSVTDGQVPGSTLRPDLWRSPDVVPVTAPLPAPRQTARSKRKRGRR